MARTTELILEVELENANGMGFSRFTSLLVGLCKAAQLERREDVPIAALDPVTPKGYKRRAVFIYNEAMDDIGSDTSSTVLAERFMAEYARGNSVTYRLSKSVPYAASDDPVAA